MGAEFYFSDRILYIVAEVKGKEIRKSIIDSERLAKKVEKLNESQRIARLLSDIYDSYEDTKLIRYIGYLTGIAVIYGTILEHTMPLISKYDLGDIRDSIITVAIMTLESFKYKYYDEKVTKHIISLLRDKDKRIILFSILKSLKAFYYGRKPDLPPEVISNLKALLSFTSETK